MKKNDTTALNHNSKSKKALDALLEFVKHVNTIDSVHEACWHLVQHTIKSLGFEDCVIYLFDKKTQTLSQVAAYGPKNPKERQITHSISLKIGQGIVGKAAEEIKSILIKDTRTMPNYVIDDEARLSELAVPIYFKDELLGVIDSENSQENYFTLIHQTYLEILAGILASRIALNSNINQLKNNFNILQKTKTLSDTFLLISELTYRSTSIEDFYLGLHKIIAKQVKTHSFVVVLLNEKNNIYSCPYLYDEKKGGEFDREINNEKMSSTLIAEVISEQRPKIANAHELKKRIQKTFKNGPQVISWLAVPFQISKTLKGAIALQSYNQNIVFNEDDKEFLTFLGQHISTAIDQKIKEQELQYLALHDSITGLANRSLFLDRLEHAFSRSNRSESSDIAVLFIDFDDFKQINDNFGHQAGDYVLEIAAQRIQTQLRGSDTLARIGGDEFAILLEDLENEPMAMIVSQRILDVMKEPIQTNQEMIMASISIGIGLKDDKVKTFEDLLRNADLAMYHAKAKGKNNIQVYEALLHQSVLSAKQILRELQTAIVEQQLLFYYQPIIHIKTQKIVGFEALLRWNHPKKGIISPNEFIAIAEQNNLIREIDSQLFDSVAKQIIHWKSITDEPFYISINISSQRFVDSMLLTEIKALLKKYTLPKNSIVIELTEHLLMKNIAKARNLFHQLRALGIQISLDDFGTGYSSLSYVHQLPFDIIKIDRSFVSYINEDRTEHPIINVIVALAKSLKLKLIAEGVETPQQLELLQVMDCDFAQGYYLKKPAPSSEIDPLLAKALTLPLK